jgi:hypothetical protein
VCFFTPESSQGWFVVLRSVWIPSPTGTPRRRRPREGVWNRHRFGPMRPATQALLVYPMHVRRAGFEDSMVVEQPQPDSYCPAPGIGLEPHAALFGE